MTEDKNSENVTSSEFFPRTDFTKLYEQARSPAFDVRAFLETQRRNIQALAEVQRLTLEDLQAVVQKQASMFSEILGDNSALAQEVLAEGTPEEKIARNAEMFKTLYARSLKGMKELSEMMKKSGEESSRIINKRVLSTMNEIQESVEKPGTKAA